MSEEKELFSPFNVVKVVSPDPEKPHARENHAGVVLEDKGGATVFVRFEDGAQGIKRECLTLLAYGV